MAPGGLDRYILSSIGFVKAHQQQAVVVKEQENINFIGLSARLVIKNLYLCKV